MAGAAQFRDFSASDNLRQLISIKISPQQRSADGEDDPKI
jgi:hypothetical protein